MIGFRIYGKIEETNEKILLHRDLQLPGSLVAPMNDKTIEQTDSGDHAPKMNCSNRTVFIGDNLNIMRMLECHRLLKETGSLYFHCDSTASHYLKIS